MRAWWMASAALAALLGGITMAGAAERARGITGAENAFNRECRYTRAYLDDERDEDVPRLQVRRAQDT